MGNDKSKAAELSRNTIFLIIMSNDSEHHNEIKFPTVNKSQFKLQMHSGRFIISIPLQQHFSFPLLQTNYEQQANNQMKHQISLPDFRISHCVGLVRVFWAG